MSAPRALVTGAAGFVGAALVRRLLADGHTVTAMSRPGCDAWRLAGIRGHADVVEVDLADADAVSRAIDVARPEYVFHLAAHGAYSWQREVSRIFQVNVLGTVHAVEASVAAGARVVVNAGSSSEYGRCDHAPAEHERPEPNSPYAASKVAATTYARCVARESGQAITTLRLYSAYGPWEEPRRLMPALVAHALRGTLPPLVDPRTARDFVHVDDVCEAFVLAAARARPGEGRVYNVASAEQTTLGELVTLTRDVFGIAAEPVWGSFPARDWDTDVWCGDSSLAAEELGWAPRISLRDGLAGFGRWMGDRDAALMARYAVDS